MMLISVYNPDRRFKILLIFNKFRLPLSLMENVIYGLSRRENAMKKCLFRFSHCHNRREKSDLPDFPKVGKPR